LPTNRGSPSPQLSVASINNILKAHNDARRRVTPAAKSMPMLKWNAKLAEAAKQYVSTCWKGGYKHSSYAYRHNATRFGYPYVGENLYGGSIANSDPMSGHKVVSTWVGEAKNFAYPGCTKSGACSRYTQVVWDKTTEVGCGYAYCPNHYYKHNWSCMYGTGGNIAGTAPYTKATTTTKATCQL
jgi:pathogenesis-related protein 1